MFGPEPAGLVKFDFLGLKTLTVLDVAVKLLRQRNIDVNMATLPIDDAPSYQMLARGDVVGVFQVESQGMRRALIDMRPDRFEDIIALVALYGDSGLLLNSGVDALAVVADVPVGGQAGVPS